MTGQVSRVGCLAWNSYILSRFVHLKDLFLTTLLHNDLASSVDVARVRSSITMFAVQITTLQHCRATRKRFASAPVSDVTLVPSINSRSSPSQVCGLEWSPDKRHLASGANDNVVCVWDESVGHEVQPVHTFTQHQAAVKVGEAPILAATCHHCPVTF